MDVLSTLVVCR